MPDWLGIAFLLVVGALCTVLYIMDGGTFPDKEETCRGEYDQ